MTDRVLAELELDSDDVIIGGLQNAIAASRQPSGTPLTLVLHGAGGGARSVAGLGQLLNAGGPLLIPDLYNYGRTGCSSRSINVEASERSDALERHRHVIETLLAVYGHPQQSVFIVGHSMGGFLGLLTALAKQRRVSALVAIEPVAFSVLDPVEDATARAEDLDKVLALHAALKAGDPESALADFIGYWSNVEWTALNDSMRQALLEQVSQISSETLAVAQDNTSPDCYRKLEIPVLLLQGELTVPPALAVVKRLRNLLQKVDVQTIAGVAHMDVARRPELYAPSINDFLNRCAAQ